MYTIDEFWLTFLVATVLPALVALVSSRVASSSVKGVLLALLSAVAGWLTSLQLTGGAFEVEAALSSVFVTFITAVSVHYGLLKPAGVTGSSGAIQRAVPGGVGGAGTHTA